MRKLTVHDIPAFIAIGLSWILYYAQAWPQAILATTMIFIALRVTGRLW